MPEGNTYYVSICPYIRDAQEYEGLNRLFSNLPKRPYCSNSKKISKILPKEKAINLRYIQINHPLLVKYIVFDLDYEGSAFACDNMDLPPFTFTVINKLNAHCHGIYEIDPVFLGTASKKTKKLLKRIIRSYKLILNADRVITKQKLLVKNPFHKDWELLCSGNIYTLSELAEYMRPIKTIKKVKKSPLDPASRNVTLFNYGRFYAYEIVSSCSNYHQLYRLINEYLLKLNAEEIPVHFRLPLPCREVNSITKSIARWVWDKKGDFMKNKNWNTGAMGFEKIKGLTMHRYKKEVRRRQSLSGKRTSAIRRERTFKKLLDAYERLSTNKVTQKKLSEHTGYSIRTVKYYWHRIIKGAKRYYQGNSRIEDSLYGNWVVKKYQNRMEQERGSNIQEKEEQYEKQMFYLRL